MKTHHEQQQVVDMFQANFLPTISLQTLQIPFLGLGMGFTSEKNLYKILMKSFSTFSKRLSILARSTYMNQLLLLSSPNFPRRISAIFQ